MIGLTFSLNVKRKRNENLIDYHWMEIDSKGIWQRVQRGKWSQIVNWGLCPQFRRSLKGIWTALRIGLKALFISMQKRVYFLHPDHPLKKEGFLLQWGLLLFWQSHGLQLKIPFFSEVSKRAKNSLFLSYSLKQAYIGI